MENGKWLSKWGDKEYTYEITQETKGEVMKPKEKKKQVFLLSKNAKERMEGFNNIRKITGTVFHE